MFEYGEVTSTASGRLVRRTGDDRAATVEALRARLRGMQQSASVAERTAADHVQSNLDGRDETRRTRPSAGPAPVAFADVVAGLRVGAVHAVESRTVALACFGAAMPSGAWGGIVGMPDLGVEAAADLGVPIDRIALVPRPGRAWLDVVASFADAMPLVLATSPGRVTPTDAARLTARLRGAGSMLLIAGAWAGATTTIRRRSAEWHGLADGDGRLADGSLLVEVVGADGVPRAARVPIALAATRPRWLAEGASRAGVSGEPAMIADFRPASVELERDDRFERSVFERSVLDQAASVRERAPHGGERVA